MKNITKIIISILLVLGLSACSNNTNIESTTCSLDFEGLNASIKLSTKDGETVSNLDTSISIPESIVMSEFVPDDIPELDFKTFKEQFPTMNEYIATLLKSYPGFSMKYVDNGADSIAIQIGLDFEKLDYSKLNELSEIADEDMMGVDINNLKDNLNYKDYIKQLENEGYTCK